MFLLAMAAGVFLLRYIGRNIIGRSVYVSRLRDGTTHVHSFDLGQHGIMPADRGLITVQIRIGGWFRKNEVIWLHPDIYEPDRSWSISTWDGSSIELRDRNGEAIVVRDVRRMLDVLQPREGYPQTVAEVLASVEEGAPRVAQLLALNRDMWADMQTIQKHRDTLGTEFSAVQLLIERDRDSGETEKLADLLGERVSRVLRRFQRKQRDEWEEKARVSLDKHGEKGQCTEKLPN